MKYNQLVKEANKLGYKGPKDRKSIETFLEKVGFGNTQEAKSEVLEKDIIYPESDPEVEPLEPEEEEEDKLTKSAKELVKSIKDHKPSVGVNTIDTKDIRIPELTSEMLSVIASDKAVKEVYTNKVFSFSEDLNDIGIDNIDCPINIKAIRDYYYGDKYDTTQLLGELNYLYGLSIYKGIHRGQCMYDLANYLGMHVFSFDILSNDHDKIIELGLPYEIVLGGDVDMSMDIENGELNKTYYRGFTKSFIGYGDKFFSSYGRKLDQNEFKINSLCEMFQNFNASGIGYLLIPKVGLSEHTKNYLLLNQTMTPDALSAMRRGMYDGKNPNEPATKDWVVSYILQNKMKHRI